MKNNGLKEPNYLIDSILNHSKEVIMAKIAIKQVRNARLITSFIKTKAIMTLDYCDEIIKELRMLIQEKEQHIKFLLEPLLKGDDYEYTGKYSISASEMKEGYAVLEKVTKRDSLGKPIQSYNCALLLTDYESDILRFSKGSIITIRGHEHILDNLQSVEINLKNTISKSTLMKYISPIEYNN